MSVPFRRTIVLKHGKDGRNSASWLLNKVDLGAGQMILFFVREKRHRPAMTFSAGF
jgi:hypothetical protein